MNNNMKKYIKKNILNSLSPFDLKNIFNSFNKTIEIINYDDIIKEIKLAVQECGRKLGRYVHKKKRVKQELKKRSFINMV